MHLGQLHIDGENAGVLTVNHNDPNDEISHTVSSPGSHSYSIEVVSVTQGAYDAAHESYCGGPLVTAMEDGSAFEVRGGVINGNTFAVSLVED